MICHPINEISQVAQVRRAAGQLALQLGFTETETGKVTLVVTEVANNLVKHATDGQVLLQGFRGPKMSGLEVMALDKGPGMANVAACLRDGYSTAGSPGTGLGAIARLSSFCDIYSVPQLGTALLVQISGGCGVNTKEKKERVVSSSLSPFQLPASSPQSFDFGAVNLAKPGEAVCGDAWAIDQSLERCLVMVVDGLGHGVGAAEAAQAAVQVVQQRAALTPREIIEGMHGALRVTRGAAVAIAVIDRSKQVVQFCGVGNVGGTIVATARNQGLVSHNGIVGERVAKIQEFTYPWTPEALLVLYSDGLTSRWTLTSYPGLTTHHPNLIAGVLYRDFVRGRDDVTVAVVRERQRIPAS